MFPDTAINQFILKLRLQAVLQGIDEKAALSYAAAGLRLATGEITEHEYHTLIDETNHVFCISPTSKIDKYVTFNNWIKQQINELQMTKLS